MRRLDRARRGSDSGVENLRGLSKTRGLEDCLFFPRICPTMFDMKLIKPLALTCLAPALVHALPEGFEAKTFAEPFEVEYPAAITAAADGTIYVSCDENGSLGKDPKYGKITSAKDTDGDGKADEFKSFVPHVLSPRGGHFVAGTLYLIHPPFLSSYRDTTGDGVADEHQILLKDLGVGLAHPRGSDHTTNGTRMGIDGWLYIAVGDFGMEGTTGTDGTRVEYRGGCVARVRPDGSELEVYSNNTRNICDVAISPYLDLFSRDNTNDGKGWDTRVHHFTNGSEHGYPRLYQNFRDEAVLPLLDVGGGSGTGALYLHEPGLPGGYDDKLLTCDWTTGKIYEHGLESYEATFKATQDVFMNLVRATDIDVDGESRLYASDWEGGKFKFAGEGVKVGSVRLITAKGVEVEKFPDLGKMNDADLVKQIGHRSAVRRLEAQRILLERKVDPMNAKRLDQLVHDDSVPLYGKVAAIFTLKQMMGTEANPILERMVGIEAVREFALRALADRKSQLDKVDPQIFVDHLNDPNPRVRLQAVIGLDRIGPRAAEAGAAAVLQLAAQPQPDPVPKGTDPRIPHACVGALVSMEATEACLAAVNDEATRPTALRALQQMHQEEVVEALTGMSAEKAVDTGIPFGALGALARLYHREAKWDLKAWWSTRPDDRGPYFEPEEWEQTPVIKTALEKGFARLPATDQPRMLEVFSKNRIDLTQLNLGQQDAISLALAAANPSPAQQEILVKAAQDPSLKWERRLSALRGLGDGNEALEQRIEVLAKWMDDEKIEAEALREVAELVNNPIIAYAVSKLRGIAAKGSDQESRIAWQGILTTAKSPLAKPNFKEEAIKMAADNPREPGFFLALADLRLSGYDQQIENAIQSDNDVLIAVAKKAKEALAGQEVGKGKLVVELPAAEVMATAMKEKGDVARGKELFTAQGCMACHALDQKAVQKGPYLGDAGGKFTRDYLIESILDPNAVVSQGFQTEVFTMKDGKVLLGFVTSEEGGKIELRDIAGVATELKEADIAERKGQPTSMMPAGLAAGLAVEDFTSLVEFLVSMKGNAPIEK